MIDRVLRPAAAVCAVVGVLAATAPPAGAITPPTVDADASPPSGSTGGVPMSQRGECVTTGLLGGDSATPVSPSQQALNLTGAWEFSRGQGQKVAVIDTGVQPGPLLPDVDGGGDFLGSGDGLTDCDGHGTLVAGIIAGQPAPGGFSGVAPEATLVSIRQTSARFTPTDNGGDPAAERARADIASLAQSIVRAADSGAQVMNISVTTCLPADNTFDQSALGAALRYAAEDRDVVIVAAAGNTNGVSSGTGMIGQCESNPLGGLANRNDPRDWSGVSAVSVPSWWQPYVLSVGSLALDGSPSSFSMAGPWVGIAAPGESIVSVSNAPDGGLADGTPNDKGKLTALSGTSYATAYVSGIAALVRSRFPDLNAKQVIERLTATAHNGARDPSNLVGAGTVDPVAALTWELPTAARGPQTENIAAPVPEPAPNHTPRNIAFAVTGLLACAVIAAGFIARRRTGANGEESVS
ncbi:type VII secretion-associated serine protease mycosin [Mycolicibacterium brumae]|uniref:Type VII secretion-associated serine protease mycosin n=1 Tax=Mycolicibacterium brumae TaxID=85968 RepID=A0A2G5PFM3_9MYCO|nr:type VII secretion-associated serine protease mycosin [Mycolicibacterium brumae]PIB77106.1 type VII secretion-associated serine protease mycosin [Mycolicibacterium brumae]RWA19264.1 hypothetical protein MBRU_17045 [Mycolicibacterium brumae DSM 44177]